MFAGGDTMAHNSYLNTDDKPLLSALREGTVDYLVHNIRKFLKRGERMLVCLPDQTPGNLGAMLCEAIESVGGIAEVWGPDLRWKGLLRQAFSRQIKAVAGPPLIILGLTKLARSMGTPLSIRNVLLTAYPASNWMIDGIDTGIVAEGKDGITPSIGSNGNWHLGTTDTGVVAKGITPSIGSNGNWWIDT